MKLAIIGSRGFNNPALLLDQLSTLNIEITEIVSGGAKGADHLAEIWANNQNIPIKVFNPDWKKFGRAAGPIRNRDLIKYCDYCIAFWDGKSKGTASSLKFCKQFNKPTKVVNYS